MYLYLFGPIKNVFSYFNKLYIPAEVEDANATIFQFESGVLGYLGTNYTSPKANWMKIYGTEANASWSISAPDVSFDEYLLAMSKQDTYTRVQLSIKGNKKQDVPLVQGDPFLEEINEFADCIRAGERPETDGNGALVALAYVRAAIVSAREGRPAKLEL
jgi:predicted dehydrogenase